MTAHILFPSLDSERPATLSPNVLRILREELGFEGVVFSDDLEMRAVADRLPIGECVRGALEAGVDALLVCSDHELWKNALSALESAPPSFLAASLRRMEALKRRFAREPRERVSDRVSSGPPYDAHRQLAARLGPAPRA